MKIDKDLILKLEKLSRLSLNDQEREVISKDLEHILDMVDKIEEIDADGVEPLRHITKQSISGRKDNPEQFEDIDSLIEQAPERKDRFIVIPKVVDKKDK